jgi:hypothetical protein
LPLILTLVVSIGLPWIALQSAAWTSMLVSFAQTNSLKESAIKTFNGKNPCELCFAAARGQSTDDDPASAGSTAKLEGCAQVDRFHFLPPVVEPLPEFGAAILSRKSPSPPTPPPRLA